MCCPVHDLIRMEYIAEKDDVDEEALKTYQKEYLNGSSSDFENPLTKSSMDFVGGRECIG
jgi:hypothetical protein